MHLRGGVEIGQNNTNSLQVILADAIFTVSKRNPYFIVSPVILIIFLGVVVLVCVDDGDVAPIIYPDFDTSDLLLPIFVVFIFIVFIIIIIIIVVFIVIIRRLIILRSSGKIFFFKIEPHRYNFFPMFYKIIEC